MSSISNQLSKINHGLQYFLKTFYGAHKYGFFSLLQNLDKLKYASISACHLSCLLTIRGVEYMLTQRLFDNLNSACSS
jgi:hypothetical protein